MMREEGREAKRREVLLLDCILHTGGAVVREEKEETGTNVAGATKNEHKIKIACESLTSSRVNS